MQNFIITLFTNSILENYTVKNAEKLEDAMVSAKQHFRNKHSLTYLEDDGIGQMSDTTNGIPQGCILLDHTPDFDYLEFPKVKKMADAGNNEAREYLKHRSENRTKRIKQEVKDEFPTMKIPN